VAASRVAIHPVWTGFSMAYLVRTSRGSLLVDAGSPGQAALIQRSLARHGCPGLDWIFLTHAHYDHFGSAGALRRATGAAVWVHPEDAADLAAGRTRLGQARGWGRVLAWLLPIAERLSPPEPTPPDGTVADGECFAELGVSLQVLHTPGHTPGSATLVVDGVHAFVGDLLSTTGGRPHAQRFLAQDWSQIVASLERLQQTDVRWLYPGHGRRPVSRAWLPRLIAEARALQGRTRPGPRERSKRG